MGGLGLDVRAVDKLYHNVHVLFTINYCHDVPEYVFNSGKLQHVLSGKSICKIRTFITVINCDNPGYPLKP
jgi:hypothetical protein